MFHRSLRRTLEAIVTPAIAVMIALAGSDFSAPGRSRRNQQKTPNSRAATTSFFHTTAQWRLSRQRGGSTDHLPVWNNLGALTLLLTSADVLIIGKGDPNGYRPSTQTFGTEAASAAEQRLLSVRRDLGHR